MPGNLSFDDLKARAAAGEIDTVVVAAPDMQGRLMGKRFVTDHFIASAHRETHCCNYLLATDLEMETVPGYAAASWAQGYGDYALKPDMATLRLIPWAPGSALVLADFLDHDGELVRHAPRAVLKRQIERLAAMGFSMAAATELEFFVFRESFEALGDAGYRGMTPISRYNEDYNLFQTAKEEGLMRAIRNGLVGAGVPVECTKGEADAGQGEVNVRYSDALDAADNHALVKQAVKEIAHADGRAVTFMAKWRQGAAGSSSHVHQSLIDAAGAPAFHDPADPIGMSDLMRHYLAGLLAHAGEVTFFLAPYVNSYKRFAKGLFAPTRAIWSVDNRTAGFRLVGEKSRSIRVECRIGGSDLNPYLALAGQIAAGISGIEGAAAPPPAFDGDAYAAETEPEIPATLRDAAAALDGSAMLRAAMGDDVIDHYVRAARWEQEEFDRAVTDHEVARGFERA
ncbi:glutamine synthetase family protein [Pikeienuella sp. HZG-20]|uniref:glutamine synthetase family protein n=1 Tax=Paludibacillus litoralis TaxID=3133267 RepID=UPI0030EDA3CC